MSSSSRNVDDEEPDVVESLESSCSSVVESSSSEVVSAREIDGMILIPASDAEVIMGTKASNAKANEKPEMKVVLDYDFYMGKREVSCGDYASLVNS